MLRKYFFFFFLLLLLRNSGQNTRKLYIKEINLKNIHLDYKTGIKIKEKLNEYYYII